MDWLGYFHLNAEKRREIPWREGVRVAPPIRAELVRSLQRFQLGESGDGIWLRRNASGEPVEYRHAQDLFIKEEQEHARLMGRVLDLLNAPRLRWHWTDWCFERVRRLLGLKLEVLVLLVAEMIAKRYFRALREGVDDVLVWLDHGKLLRACGVRAEGFWWDCGLIFDEVSAGVFGGAAYPSLAGLRMPEFQWRPPLAE